MTDEKPRARIKEGHSGIRQVLDHPYKVKLEEHYKKLKQLLPTPTDIEVEIAKMMGLYGYDLQMPLRHIFQEDQVIPILDLKTEKKEFSVSHKKNNGPARLFVGATRIERNQMAVRWCEYQSAKNVPKSFRHDYPYLYAILRDIFCSQLQYHRENIAIEKKMIAAQQIVNIVASAFYQFHQFMQKIPGVKNWLQDPQNKKDIEVIQIIEDLLQDLVDAQKPVKKVYIKP